MRGIAENSSLRRPAADSSAALPIGERLVRKLALHVGHSQLLGPVESISTTRVSHETIYRGRRWRFSIPEHSRIESPRASHELPTASRDARDTRFQPLRHGPSIGNLRQC